MIAHRGASAYAPDNTFAAFDLALAQGADVLELDVRLGADARMLCLHDPCAEGETAGAPCLDAVLERYGDRTRYLVDLKDPEAGWEGEVAALLARRGVLERAMVQSFDLDALARLHRIAPELPLAAVYRRATSAELSVAAVPAFARAVCVHHPRVDERFVAEARARSLAVLPWTIDDAPEAERMLALGVDAIVTNAPDVVRAAVSGAAQQHLGDREVGARVDVEHAVGGRVGAEHDRAEAVEGEREGLVGIGGLEAA
ncbi:MAG: glycerophosphodiester phosphodiesterase [Actinomycetota bacterium]|nr:glycerophosphodiester phosphodiesterase [Actinomycetota bacterium]